MSRPIRTLLVAALSLLAGACTGRVRVALLPVLPPPSFAELTPQPIVSPLPIHQFSFAELVVAPALAQAPVEPPSCSVMAKIQEVHEKTAGMTLTVGKQEYRYTEVRGGRTVQFKDPEKQIALGLLNPETCITRIVTITKRGDQLIAPSGYDIEAIRRVNGIRWNNWATDYRVNTPEGWFVIANLYPYVQEEGIGRKRTRTITPVFYSGYSPELATPEAVSAGPGYQKELSQQADAELRAADVRSRVYPTMRVVDVPVLKAVYAERRVPIEHMDQSEFLLDPSGTTDRVHILIGLNRERFGSLTCSPAKACGRAQFIQSTWKMIRLAYPGAQLSADFKTGARDPLQSAKATRLLDDYHLGYLKENLASAEYDRLIADPHLTEEALAAAYNTGPARVVAVLKAYFADPRRFGDWAQASGRSKKARLPNETKGYIAKLRYVRDEWPSRQESRADLAPIR